MEDDIFDFTCPICGQFPCSTDVDDDDFWELFDTLPETERP